MGEKSILGIDSSSFKLLKGRKIFFLNIRSILANINGFRSYLENSNLLACGLSETWLNNNVHNKLISINGFNLVRLDRVTKKRGGGLLFYINVNALYEVIENQSGSGTYSDHNIEMLL